ncbi:hypothetical protein ATANTOWER_001093 [Ataeniobius toweri]|uniref:Uncharacterized protein n=1 Tax=Ataeniobius toweri TaxID=208326 RepID=A0ABU7C4X7_9TELE|nr:hypothetical protein [Ataeniobius toweri]
MGSKDESRITLESFASPSQGNVDTHRTEDSERSRKHPWIVPTFSPRNSSWNRALNRQPSGWHGSNIYSRTSCPPQADKCGSRGSWCPSSAVYGREAGYTPWTVSPVHRRAT